MANLKQQTKRAVGICGSRVAIISLLLVCFVFPNSQSFPPAYADSPDSPTVSTTAPAGRLAVFDEVWQTVYDRYYDPSFHGVDWWAKRAQFRQLAATAQDSTELYSILRRLLGLLRDAHTRVYAPEQKFDWEHPRFVTVGLSLREVQGRITAFRVERGSEAERRGIRAGDVVQTIDGQDALMLWTRKLSEQNESSTPQVTRLFAFASLTDGTPGTSIAIEWLNAHGKIHRANLQRHWQQRALGVRISKHDGIAVVELEGFTRSAVNEFFREVLPRLDKARGMVIDLRNNGGGEAQAMAEMAGAFLPPTTALGQFTDRQGNVSLRLEAGIPLLFGAKRNRPLEIPIVILAGPRTSSAAEIFLEAMKQTGRATVLGDSTCGCVLAVRTRHALPDGGELEVSELDYHTASGVRLEGSGIAPDEIVGLTRRDLYDRKDNALLLALARINSHRR